LSVDLFCTLFVFVFGRIVGPNIRIRPNSDIHIFSTALIYIYYYSVPSHDVISPAYVVIKDRYLEMTCLFLVHVQIKLFTPARCEGL